MRERPPPRSLGDGVHSVAVPIPGSPLGYTLVYALESERGPVLVDAGWQDETAWEALRAGLAGLGLAVGEVYGVIVTHHHPDHAGLAGRVREESGAWIAMHRADVEVVRRFRELTASGERAAWEVELLRRAGAAPADLEEFAGTPARIDPPALPDRELDDGDLADVPGRKLRVVWTPGHSPGHICLHLEDQARLFTGDHVLPKITPHIGLYPYDLPDVDPLGDFLAALERVADLEVGQALPAHERGFDDLAGRVEELIRHHRDRLAELERVLAGAGGAPVTLWELASRLEWNVPWAAMPLLLRRLATGEAASHLRLLERRGRVRTLPGSDPLRFAAAGQALDENMF